MRAGCVYSAPSSVEYTGAEERLQWNGRLLLYAEN